MSCSSTLRVGRGATDPTPEKFVVTNPHGGGQDLHMVVAPVYNKKTKLNIVNTYVYNNFMF
jgi:hypothetical protein